MSRLSQAVAYINAENPSYNWQQINLKDLTINDNIKKIRKNFKKK